MIKYQVLEPPNGALGGRIPPPQAFGQLHPPLARGAGEVRGPVLYQRPFRRPGGGLPMSRPRPS